MERPSLLPRPMQIEEFTPLVGRTLVADCDPRAAELTLVEASPLRHGIEGNRPPFILIFRSSPDVLLVAGSYTIRAEEFDPAIIEIAQISPPPASSEGHYYQAIFN